MQFQENCVAVFRPELRKNRCLGRARSPARGGDRGVGDIVHYINAVFDAWRGQVNDPGKQCVFSFLLLLLAVDIACKGWRLSWSRRAVESVAATLAIFHINLVLVPAVWLLSEQFKTLYSLLGIPSVASAVWDGLPVWLLSLVAILAHDFANYWNHRVMHLKWLWPVHAIHHSDPVVNGLTTYRVHALEMLVMWGSYTILLTWLGLPADAMGIGAAILVLHNVYVHVDVDWGHGPLRMLIASPRFHRWHHANEPAAYGKNLANVFPFFDWIFGTYRVPGPCAVAMGADGIPSNDVVRLTLWPLLEWARMASQRLKVLRYSIGGLARDTSRAEVGTLDTNAD
ncbi:MAG: sterol desaturase family protein [Mesorhizobium sp.]|nr:MAG: sterol desaturase family protein [Mesorhizobium sp.]